MRPVFKPDPQILSKFYLKCHIIFQNCGELSSKFGKFWYQIDEKGPIFAPITQKFENMTHVHTSFCTEY